MERITVALARGKLFEGALALLRRLGWPTAGLADVENRSLLVEAPGHGLRYILCRPFDVPVYVQHGAADLGIVGKDTLLEGRPPVYELVDLGFGACRFVIAAPEGADPGELLGGSATRRVATKFPRYTEEVFRRKGLQVEIIHLHGSIELAPAAGLADMIVDITQTGRTLRENGLQVIEELDRSTARLVANRVSYRLKAGRLAPIIQAIKEETRVAQGQAR